MMSRPRTSTPRGVCRYYNTDRGCFAGQSCKFLHGEQERLTPYDQAKTCRFYAQGYCKRGDDCWLRHELEVEPVAKREDPMEDVCNICLDKPSTYGLLSGCGHLFCISCIRQWRNPSTKSSPVLSSGVTKKCPLCRSPSFFITPSSQPYPHLSEQKEDVIKKYKESMKRVPCKYFAKKGRGGRLCPFGSDCFYAHRNEDGSEYVFTHGVDINRYVNLRAPNRNRTNRHGFRTSRNSPSGFSFAEALDALRTDVVDFDQRVRVNIADLQQSVTSLLDYTDYDGEFEESGEEDEANFPGFFEDIYGHDVDEIDFLEQLTGRVLNTLSTLRHPSPTPTPPPLEPVDIPTQSGSDGDSMPSLPSVSDSSDESDSGGGGDSTNIASSLLSRRTIPFGTVVGQDEGVIINLDDSDESDDEDMEIPPLSPLHPSPSPSLYPNTRPDNDSEVTPGTSELHETSEPPFLTDGRGRVVWSSMRHPAPTTAHSSPPTAIPSPSLISRNSKRRLSLASASPTGFTTDGRGRVIGTANPQVVSVDSNNNSDPSTEEQVNDERLNRLSDGESM